MDWPVAYWVRRNIAGSKERSDPFLRTAKPQRDMVLWYRQPGPNWLEAMPLGNGMIGAMVFGGVPQERIALNEVQLLVRPPARLRRSGSLQYFRQIRDLVFADKFQEAEKTGRRAFLRHTHGAGGLPTDRRLAGSPLTATRSSTDYRRELNMETGVAKVSYRRRCGHHPRDVRLLAGPRAGRAHHRRQARSRVG